MPPLDYRRSVERAEHVRTVTEYEMGVHYAMPVHIDETSILFREPWDLDGFLVWAAANGWEHFNTVEFDRLHLLDHSPDFNALGTPGADRNINVRFEFLRRVGADWRIEALCIHGGHAPLHQDVLQRVGNGAVVHASYKPEWYHDEVERLRGALPFMAEYRNSYGRFSYWTFGSWYLKPRMSFLDQMAK